MDYGIEEETEGGEGRNYPLSFNKAKTDQNGGGMSECGIKIRKDVDERTSIDYKVNNKTAYSLSLSETYSHFFKILPISQSYIFVINCTIQ